MAVQELNRDQQELVERIARFREGLEPIERQILDTVVCRACEPSEEAAPVAPKASASSSTRS